MTVELAWAWAIVREHMERAEPGTLAARLVSAWHWRPEHRCEECWGLQHVVASTLERECADDGRSSVFSPWMRQTFGLSPGQPDSACGAELEPWVPDGGAALLCTVPAANCASHEAARGDGGAGDA